MNILGLILARAATAANIKQVCSVKIKKKLMDDLSQFLPIPN